MSRERLIRWAAALAATCGAYGGGLLLPHGPLAVVFVAMGVLALIICLARSHVATYVVIAILYSNAAAVAVQHHGLPEIVGLAFPLILALPLAEHLLLRRQPVTITRGLPFLFGYMLVQVLAAFGARDVPDAVESLIAFLIGGFGLYFVLINVFRSFSSLRYAVWTVVVTAAVIGALSTFQAVTGSYGNDYWGFSTVDLPGREEHLTASLEGTPRHEGPIGEKNRYGQIMLVLVPLGALLALGEQKRSRRVVAALSTLLILSGMTTSFSRGAAVGLLVVLLVAFVFRYIKPVHVVLIAAMVVLLAVSFPRYSERLVDLQGLTQLDRTAGGTPAAGDINNLRGRATTVLTGLFVWADHPLVGVGRGEFELYYEEYAGVVADAGVDTHIDQGVTRQPHNLFTGTLAETGALGFACFVLVFVVTLRDLDRVRRRWSLLRPDVAHLAMGFFLAIIGYLATGIALHLSYERYLWFLLALAGAAAHLALKGDESNDFQVDTRPAIAAQRPPVAATS